MRNANMDERAWGSRAGNTQSLYHVETRSLAYVIRNTVVALFCLLICTVAVLADTLTLKDGTVLQGKVQEVGDKYWIKLADGGTKMVAKSEVTKFERGDAAAPRPGPARADQQRARSGFSTAPRGSPGTSPRLTGPFVTS